MVNSQTKRTIYLAARYARHRELQRYAADLRECGYRITSTWIAGAHAEDDAAPTPKQMREWAEHDLHDLREAAYLIAFTESPTEAVAGAARGARHVEFGFALAEGKRCIVVGPVENIFHALPQVEHFATWEACLDLLLGEAVMMRRGA